jgi:hypothetical protein
MRGFDAKRDALAAAYAQRNQSAHETVHRVANADDGATRRDGSLGRSR